MSVFDVFMTSQVVSKDKEIEQLKAQRGELLAACQDVLGTLQAWPSNEARVRMDRVAIKTAIANVEKGQVGK